jgi:hypothetical protein
MKNDMETTMSPYGSLTDDSLQLLQENPRNQSKESCLLFCVPLFSFFVMLVTYHLDERAIYVDNLWISFTPNKYFWARYMYNKDIIYC